MQINESYWGGMGTTNLYYSFDVTTKTMFEGFNDSAIPLNETLDLSIAPWAINPNADILGLQYCLMTTSDNGATVQAHTYDLLDIERDSQTGVPFFFIGENSFSSGNYWDDFYWTARNAYNQATLEDILDIKYRTQKPIVRNFDYSRLVCVPYIHYTQRPTPSYDNYQEFWMFRRDLTDSWLSSNYITGISLTWYYATAESTPNSRSDLGRSFMMSTLANFKDITNYISGANKTYSNPFLANCLTMPYIGTNYGRRFDCGTYNSYDYSVSWYNTVMDAYNAKFDLASMPYPMLHTGSNYAGSNTLLKTMPIPRNNYTSFAMSYLDTDGMTAAEVLDYIYRQLAYLGVWICDQAYAAQREAIGSSTHWMLGEIGGDGVTTGKYAWGTDTSDLANSMWVDPWEESGYQGRNDDPNQYSEETKWNSWFTGTAGFCKAYILDDLKVEDLHSKFYASLNNIPSGTTITDYVEGTYLTNNPTDVIMSLRYYNLDLYDALVVDPQNPRIENIYLGAYDTGTQAPRVGTQTKLFDYGSCVYYPHFGDFRDYEPYSYAQLIIPYCGTIKISPSDYMGHTIKLQMGIDFATGACTAYIYRDELMIESISGQMGIDVPVSAIASSDLQRDIFNNANALKQAKTTANQNFVSSTLQVIGGAATLNPLAVASGLSNMVFGTERSEQAIEAAEYNLEHTKVNFKSAGAAAPALNALQEQQARLVIYRPIMQAGYSPEIYGKTTGFATLEHGTLSSYTGYTRCATLKVDDINCTASEKQQIIKLLQSGIYL